MTEFQGKITTLAMRYVGFTTLMKFTILFSSTFYILYIINLVDFVQAGILVSIGFLVQAVIDYPTGVFADWLGYKRVLFAAYIGHFTSFLALGLLPLLNLDNVFPFLIVVYAIESFSLAQESGALQSWFDNSYKLEAKDMDPEKSIYKDIFGKTLMLTRLVGGIAIYLGGFISDLLGREVVFIGQAILSMVIAILFLKYLTDARKEKSSKITVKEYNKRLLDGVKIVFGTRAIFFFSLTYVIIFVVNRIWAGLIILPVYFGYTGSDGIASILRGTLFILGSLMTGLSTRVSRNLNERRHLWKFFILHGILVYGLYTVLLSIFPISTKQSEAEFNVIAVIFIVIIASYANFSSAILLTMSQKIIIELIPDTHRNSYYSLMPSLTLIVSSAFIIPAGQVISSTGNFSLTVFIFTFIPVIICAGTSYIAMSVLNENDIGQSVE